MVLNVCHLVVPEGCLSSSLHLYISTIRKEEGQKYTTCLIKRCERQNASVNQGDDFIQATLGPKIQVSPLRGFALDIYREAQ